MLKRSTLAKIILIFTVCTCFWFRESLFSTTSKPNFFVKNLLQQLNEANEKVLLTKKLNSQREIQHTSPTPANFLAGTPPKIIFPKKWKLKKTTDKELPMRLIERLINEIDWPAKLSLSQLFPTISRRNFPNRKTETLVNYDVKVKGFLVPQSYLRVFLFEDIKGDLQIGYIDQHFQLPPEMSFSIRISKEVAIKQAQLQESNNLEVWKASGEWRFLDTQWKPSWKIQLLNSSRTYFIDVRNGELDFENATMSIKSEVQITGNANQELKPEKSLLILPLPRAIALTPNKVKLIANDDGRFISEVPLSKLNFILKNSVVNTIDSIGIAPTYSIITNTPLTKILFNPLGSSRTTPLINAFIGTTKIHDFLVDHVGLNKKKLNVSVNAIVNTGPQDCEANYQNGAIFFEKESDECNSTAYDTMIFHEYTHFVDDLFGGIKDRALSEGMGDIVATFETNQPFIGRGVLKNNSKAIRSTEEVHKFLLSPTLTMAAIDLIYNNGQAWSEFAWKARSDLMTKYGFTDGSLIAEFLFLSVLETNAANIPSALAEVFARDAQGLKIEESPDYTILLNASKAHGLNLPSQIPE